MGVSGIRNRVLFGRLFADAQDLGLQRRQDYVYFEHSVVNGRHQFNVKVWKNVGSGSTKLKGEGILPRMSSASPA